MAANTLSRRHLQQKGAVLSELPHVLPVLCMLQFLTIPHTSAFTFLGKRLDIYFLDTLLFFSLYVFFPLALF